MYVNGLTLFGIIMYSSNINSLVFPNDAEIILFRQPVRFDTISVLCFFVIFFTHSYPPIPEKTENSKISE